MKINNIIAFLMRMRQWLYNKIDELTTLSLEDQRDQINKWYPGVFKITQEGSKLIIASAIKPYEGMARYDIVIEYVKGERPTAKVPSLPVFKGEIGKLLCMHPDGSLGLYRGKTAFTSRKYIAKTIIPWTVLWLYWYERWVATGEWKAPRSPSRGLSL